MDLLVSYDVCTEKPEGRRRLRKVAIICLDFGQRVQKSMFECSLSEMDYERLRHRLIECVNPQEDSLRIYQLPTLGSECVEHFGVKAPIDFDGALLV